MSDDFSRKHDRGAECAVKDCDHNAKPEYGRFCGVHKADYYKAKSDYFENLSGTIGRAHAELSERHKRLNMQRSKERRQEADGLDGKVFLWTIATHSLVVITSVVVTYAVMR